jgi:hypothetical protein
MAIFLARSIGRSPIDVESQRPQAGAMLLAKAVGGFDPLSSMI